MGNVSDSLEEKNRDICVRYRWVPADASVLEYLTNSLGLVLQQPDANVFLWSERGSITWEDLKQTLRDRSNDMDLVKIPADSTIVFEKSTLDEKEYYVKINNVVKMRCKVSLVPYEGFGSSVILR